MKRNKSRPKKAAKNPVSLGAVVRENLPYPVVYYPNHYGTFFAFGKYESSDATLCLCFKPGKTIPVKYSAWPTDSAEVVSSNRNFLRLKGSVKQSPQNVMK